MIGSLVDTRNVRLLSHPAHLSACTGALIGMDVAARLLPHAPNCTPLAASALFAGFIMRSGWAAALVPFISMLISDLIIGSYDWRIMMVVYASIILPAFVGRFGRVRYGGLALGGLALGGSLAFFIATNAAVWLFSGIYTTNLDGLIQCYIAAWPFLKNTVCGDLLWATFFFVAWRMAISGKGIVNRMVYDVTSKPPGTIEREQRQAAARPPCFAQLATQPANSMVSLAPPFAARSC